MAIKRSTLIARNARRTLSKRFRQWGRVLINQEVELISRYPEDLPASEERPATSDSQVESQH